MESATRVQSAVSRWDYARTQLGVLVTYLRLLAFPIGQNFDHDVPLETSFASPRVILAGALLAGLAALAVILFRRGKREGGARVAAFGIAWFFLVASVESSVVPIADLMAEHRVYLPSIGPLVALAVGAAWLARRLAPARGPAVLAGVALGIASLLAVATFQRNRVWASELSFWGDAVAKSPGKARGHAGLATAFGDVGRLDEAVQEYETAIRLDPAAPDPCYNLARLYLAQGARTEEAAALLQRAVLLRPGSLQMRANLAAALNRLGRFEETIRLLQEPESVRLLALPIAEEEKGQGEARFNLGVAYAGQGDRVRARSELEPLRSLSPELAERLEAFIGR
jgi:Flp pilus assembly protein TadD